MLTKADNELLTRTGPGTGCGDLLRRYWQPAALSEELPAGGPPVPLTLMGEELVLFRDPDGRVGLLGLHCAHRGADLSYGRLEDGGLRCIYHGWLYDVQGNCLEQPGEPVVRQAHHERNDVAAHPELVEGFHERIHQRSYPCREAGGAIFAYLGGDEPPLLPGFDFLTAPDDHVFAIKLYSECNYLQGNEGNIDILHVGFLHSTADSPPYPGAGSSVGVLSHRGVAPHQDTIETQLTSFGLQTCRIRALPDGSKHLAINSYVVPNLTFVGGNFNGRAGYTVNWHVPIDDTHHWRYTFIYGRERPLDPEVMRRGRAAMTPDYRSLRKHANRYQQDRAAMAAESYSGMGTIFQPHDLCVTEGAGPIQDRTREHTPVSDVPIVMSRNLILKAIADVQRGQDPPLTIRDPAVNCFPYIRSYGGIVSGDTDWRDFIRQTHARADNETGLRSGAIHRARDATAQ